MKQILDVQNLSKSFSTNKGEVRILENVNFSVLAGQTVAIIGPSGSGKSTLLSLLGLLDTPTKGDIHLEGKDISQLNETEQAAFRNQKIGFIFQSFELISPFTVNENIQAPLDIAGLKEDSLVSNLVEDIGLSHRQDAMPRTLSGGEKQRVAIARALVRRPALILADEPTGSLDRVTGEKVLDMLLGAVAKTESTLIIITHDESIATRMDRVFEIKNLTIHERL